MSHREPAPTQVHLLKVLRHGELRLVGRLADSTNNAMVAICRLDGREVRCVYKPLAGERPLWDFPGGGLARREVAAFEVGRIAGWDCVPATVLRDGPAGPGMVQRWVDDNGAAPVALYPANEVPAGWIPVLSAVDEAGEKFVAAHADSGQLQVIAAFDVIVNNADRKGSHLLATQGTILGVDHGLTFHTEPKLRTVLWGWAGRTLPERALAGLAQLHARRDELNRVLRPLLDAPEIGTLHARISSLATARTFPEPPADRTAIPWPPL